MKKATKTLAERVFDLVRSLSTTEKNNFLVYVKSDSLKRKHPQYLEIFELYLNSPKFSSKRIDKRIKKGKTSFEAANKYLRKVVLESLAHQESDQYSGVLLIREAVARGFMRYSKQILEKELVKAFSKEDVESLLRLYNEFSSISRYHMPGLQLPKGLMSQEAFHSEIQILSKSKALYHAMRPMLQKSANERLIEYKKRIEDLDSIQGKGYFTCTRYSILKTERVFYRLIRDQKNSFIVQKRINHLIEDQPSSFSWEKRIDEKHLFISFLLRKGEFQLAKQELNHLASTEIPTYLEDQLNKVWLLDSIFLAAGNSDWSFSSRAVKDYIKFEHLLSPYWKVYLTHAISFLFFYKGDFRNASYWQSKLSNFPIRVQLRMAWIPYVVRAIQAFEEGYFSKVRKIYR